MNKEATQLPTIDPRFFLNTQDNNICLNFLSGYAKFCLQALCQQDQLNAARELTAICADDGKSLKERLSMYLQLTAANLFLSCNNKIGKDCFQYRSDSLKIKKEEKARSIRKAKEEYDNITEKAEKIKVVLTGQEKKKSRHFSNLNLLCL